MVISTENRYVCLADGRKVPFEEYTEQSREFILDVSHKGMDELLRIWIDKGSRHELREALRDRDIYPSAFRHYLELPDADDVDILAKIGFQLPRVPNRADRANRLWDEDQSLAAQPSGRSGYARRVSASRPMCGKPRWTTTACSASTTSNKPAPIARRNLPTQFGSFTTLTQRYGGPALLKADLELVKKHLYVPMVA